MKRRKKILLLSSLIAVLVGFNYLTFVWGQDDGGGASAGGSGSHDSGMSNDACWYGSYTETENWGIRISVVNDKGSRVSGSYSIDIFPGELRNGAPYSGGQYHTMRSDDTIYTITNPSDRVGRFDFLWNAAIHQGKQGNTASVEGLIDDPAYRHVIPFSSLGVKYARDIPLFTNMKNAGYSLNILNSNSNSYTGDKMAADINTLYNYVTVVDKNQGYSDLMNFLRMTGYTENIGQLTKAELEDRYILFEPIYANSYSDPSLIDSNASFEQRYNAACGHKQMIYGTVTEIAAMFSYRRPSDNGSRSDIISWAKFPAMWLKYDCPYSKCTLGGPGSSPGHSTIQFPFGDCPTIDGGKCIVTTTPEIKNIWYFEGFGILWLGDIVQIDDSCSEVVKAINEKYKNNLITIDEYHAAIQKVATGNFTVSDAQFYNAVYTKPDGSTQYYVITSPQNYEFLNPSFYEDLNYNSSALYPDYVHNGTGLAHCDAVDPRTQETQCDVVVNTLNSYFDNWSSHNFGETYDAVIQRIISGQFKQEDAEKYGIKDTQGNFLTITTPQTYDLLYQSIYTDSSKNPHRDNRAHCEPAQDIVCDPHILANMGDVDQNIDACVTGNTYFRESDLERVWLECETAFQHNSTLYSSENTGHEAQEDPSDVTSYADLNYTPGVVGNAEYCQIFCYEEFETDFPTNVYGVKAGRIFRWSLVDNNFGEITVHKHCTTQDYVSGSEGYQYPEWFNDYKTNEQELLTNYMIYFGREKMNDLIDAATADTDSHTCYEGDPDPVTGEYPPGSDYTCYSASVDVDGFRVDLGTVPAWVELPSSYYDVPDASGSSDHWYRDEDDAIASAKDDAQYDYDDDIEDAYTAYTNALANQPFYVLLIQQCTRNLKYIYNTTVRLDFAEPVNNLYGANARGFSSTSYLEPTNYRDDVDNVDFSACDKVTVQEFDGFEAPSATANGGFTTSTDRIVYDCSDDSKKVVWDYTGKWAYYYPIDEFTWWSLKIGDQLVNTPNKPSEPDGYFYSLGFGLPTAFSLTDGTYPLKVVVSNIGDNGTTSVVAEGTEVENYNSPDGHFAPLFDTKNSDNLPGFDYECIYEVTNEIFGFDCEYDSNGNLLPESPSYCDPQKDGTSEGHLNRMDLVYRLVALLDKSDTTGTAGGNIDKAFPSIDGSGREPGPNWRLLTDDEIREVLDDQVYNGPAMYEIELDVNGIQYIRKDNRTYFNASYDPYTEYKDIANKYSSDYKIICINKNSSYNNKYCASEFLTELHDHTNYGLNHWLEGTCFVGTTTQERAELILDNDGVCGGTYNGIYDVEWERNN